MKVEVFYKASVMVEADTVEEAARKYQGLELGNVVEFCGAYNDDTSEEISTEFYNAL